MSTKKRVSIYLNGYELALLFGTKLAYSYSGNFVPFQPETKEILQAVLNYSTAIVSQNRHSLRSFAHEIARKKNYGPIEYAEMPEKTRYVEVGSLQISKEERVAEFSGKDYVFNRTYIFPLEEQDISSLNNIRKYLTEDSEEKHYSLPKLKDVDIVRECIHFILSNKRRRRDFLLLTFIGHWYMLKPVTSLKAFETSDDEYDDVLEMLYKTLDQEEFDLIIKIKNDRKKFEKYKKKLTSVKFKGREFKKFEMLESESQSDVSMFNFQTAFFGFWVLDEYINLFDLSIPLIIALSMTYPIQEKEWKASTNSLVDTVEFLIKRSEDLAEYVEKLNKTRGDS